MNNRLFILSVLAFACIATSTQAQTSTDPNEGSQLSQNATTGTYTFCWWGRAGRTYFLQQSDELLNWSYLPVIESGAEQPIQWSLTSSAPRSFLRLRYTDIVTNDPFNDDFNNDGLSNWQNLTQGSDPLAAPLLDTNGLSLNWEQFYNIPPGTDPNVLAPRGDGLTYLQAYQRGLNPNDFYNGQTPHVLVVSGTPQTGPANGFVPLPLIVSITDDNGNPFRGAPVTFTVSQGGGQVQRSSTAAPGTSITIFAEVSGQARVFFKLPNVPSNTSQVTATVGSGSHLASATFMESSDNGSGGGGGGSGGGYPSPFDPTNVTATLNSDGSMDVTWTSNADPGDTDTISIQDFDENGNYHTIATAPAGATSYHIPAP